MKLCRNCGIGSLNEKGEMHCLKYKTVKNFNEGSEDCVYFIETLIEDGETLPPLQHLLLSEGEQKTKKLKAVT
ncbi:MAG: hypothetical protein JM58_01620 [Peptococcaceae bacterium BICA1-8]|nr:MAG: hypothetical protein JM58_01620 [Peptococcaceae bacterium BICA1-8]